MMRKQHNNIRKCTIKDLTTRANLKAILSNIGSGGGMYPIFKPFTILLLVVRILAGRLIQYPSAQWIYIRQQHALESTPPLMRKQ